MAQVKHNFTSAKSDNATDLANGDVCPSHWNADHDLDFSGGIPMAGGLITGLGNGSASAPSLAFANSTTTGIYRNAANEIGFTINGTRRALLTSTGLSSTNLFTDGQVGFSNSSTGQSFISYNDTQKTMYITNDGSTVAGFSKTALLLGNLSILYGQGIKFPATQSPSSDVNTLDDYEEGVWTPTDLSGAGLTFTSSNAWYIKIGKLLAVCWAVGFPATASTAIVQFGGLPYACTGYGYGTVVFPNGASWATAATRSSSNGFSLYKENGWGTNNSFSGSSCLGFGIFQTVD